MKNVTGYLAFVLLLLLIVAMGCATWVEHFRGTEYAWTAIYRSPWFNILWTWLALAGIYFIFTTGLWKKLPVFLLHISLIIIVAGAAVTRFSGKTGIIHLREQQAAGSFFCEETRRMVKLPFSLTLKAFQIEYYSGTEAPSNYKSLVEIDHPESGNRLEFELSMNHILKYQGYRFYQASFDEDRKGSILRVNRDTAGIAVTYAGYGLLFLSMVWVLVDRRGRFVELLRRI